MGTSQLSPSSLPPLYTPWIEEVLGDRVPEERHATCSACAMCTPTNDKAATASLRVFDPATKCCTYLPALPNFLVGMVLDDGDPEAAPGRQSVAGRIAAGIGVTPLGLFPGAEHVLVYKHVSGDLFGRTSGLRCPHYLADGGGRCGIWRQRNAVCSTWFCKFERGRVGKQFWDALLALLTTVERHLSLWAATELGEPVERLGPALLPYYATVLEQHEARWSPRWDGRLFEFYRESATLVRGLTWSRVREIGGPEVTLFAGKLRAAFEALHSTEVPSYLRLGAVAFALRLDGTCAVSGYSAGDMIVLSEREAVALASFDGRRSTDEVCTALAKDSGITLENTCLRRLVDFGVLLPMPPGTGAAYV